MDWLELGYLGLFLASFLSATVLPGSSEAVLAALIAGGANPWIAIGVATLGNWLGGISSYGIGYLGKWQWMEKYLGVEKQKVEKWKPKIDRYGSFFGLLSFVPFIGDVIVVALGYFRVRFWLTCFWMLLGKLGRYVSIYGGMLIL
jgi:membrane protein YqaA with SNARE-associated domain